MDTNDIFGEPGIPDLASAIAAEVLGLEWTHAQNNDVDEHCNRYGDVQEAAASVIARLRSEYPDHDFMQLASA